MFFKLNNLSKTFQIYINRVMHFYLNVFVLIYINDILNFLKSTKKYVEHVKLILKQLRKFNFFAKLSKCNFHISQMKFFDFRVSFDDISMQKSKIVTIQKWLLSKSHKNFQFFIEFVNFYRRFVYAFFRASFKLTSFFKKDEKNKFKIKFVLILKRIQSMKTLKRVFTSSLMFRRYELDNELMMKINVSNFVIATMFFQFEEIDDHWRSMIFFFRKITISKRNYEFDEQEMLTIIKICKDWRHYVENLKYFV
jgi:hypothetical protein